MSVHVLDLPGYELDDVKKRGDEIPEGIFLFKWLMLAFYAKRSDPMSGNAKPLIRLGTDPERVDSSLALLEAFEGLRMEVVSEGQTVYRLRQDGGHLALDTRTVDLLLEYWTAYATEFLGSGEDAKTMKRIGAALATLKENKLTPAAYAQAYGDGDTAAMTAAEDKGKGKVRGRGKAETENAK